MVEQSSDQFVLSSYDPSVTAYGFFPYYNKYAKYADRLEIDSIYYYDTYAEYKGNTVSVIDNIGDNLLLYGEEMNAAKKLFRFILRLLGKLFATEEGSDNDSDIDDSCKYEKWVKREEVDRIWTIRKPIWGFPEPNIITS
ncbi:hypothetical protein [Brevibacillus sp. SYSU BS000544]|uniref:hypothetical protein n=1 Tax=Brevibacillus sp. SYSU BS000544 TaxID=3416443 RepID=UPI003CE49A71